MIDPGKPDFPDGPAPTKLVVRPALGYGTRGGHCRSGKTLVFVIDLLAVR